MNGDGQAGGTPAPMTPGEVISIFAGIMDATTHILTVDGPLRCNDVGCSCDGDVLLASTSFSLAELPQIVMDHRAAYPQKEL